MIPDRDAVDLVAHTRSGELSALEVVDAHLDRIAERNPHLNAIVAMYDDDQIRAEARRLDDDAAPRGPLHGLPVAVKDLEDVAGLPTRAGSTTTSSEPVEQDGIVAQRLRAAGAIIIGKTNTPEFGTGSHTFNEIHGVTRNPHDPARSARGSSGGAASALASGMLPIADGSDLGGSLRNPAAFCGVVGLRPSVGRVPSIPDRSTHLLRSGVRGPMARTVADCALLLSALAGPDPRDPLSLPDPGSSFESVTAAPGTIRIAWAGDLGGAFTAEKAVLFTCRRALEDASRVSGIETFDATPDLHAAMDVFRVLRGLSYRGLGDELGEQLDDCKASVRENVAYGRSLQLDDLLAAEQDRARIHASMTTFFESYDLLALPAAQVLPFPVETEYPSRIEGVDQHDYLEWMSACCIITTTGCPAISIPAGTANGLPVGLQLVAPVGADAALLSMAAVIERVLSG